MDRPTIFVTGATGNQGGAVCKQLSAHGFQVIALVRNLRSEKAQELKTHGVILVLGDLNSPKSYRIHLQDIDGVFSVQTFKGGITSEISQGINLANEAKKAGVKHFVYTSVIAADCNSGVPHFESKKIIEDHIKGSGIAYTIVRPASFYENFLIPQIRKELIKGKLVQAIDKTTVMQYVAADDIGKAVLEIFRDPDKYSGQIITLCSETLSPLEAAKVFSEVLNRDIRYERLPSIITRIFVGKNVYKMFKWLDKNTHSFDDSVDKSRTMFPGMLDLKSWAVRHFT